MQLPVDHFFKWAWFSLLGRIDRLCQRQDSYNRYMQKHQGKVVTKYSFPALLSEAWGKTKLPAVISSGFKRSGDDVQEDETAVDDDLEEFIQKVINDQGELTQVEIINDKHIDATEPANLKESEVDPRYNCREQSTPELPST